MITEAQIQAIVQRIVEGYAPDRTILFGLYAYGTPTEDSDMDLLIIKEKAETKRAERFVAVWRHLWDASLPAMDTLIRTPIELAKTVEIACSVEAMALQQGRLLYAA